MTFRAWLKDPIIAVVAVAILLLDPTIAALLVAAPLKLSGLAGRLGPVGWIALAPVLYFAWLLVNGLLSAGIVRLLARKGGKPRHAVINFDTVRQTPEVYLLASCYQRAAMARSLPLAQEMLRIPILQRLALASYSPEVHLGHRVTIYGQITDPDLTEIGDGVVLGDGCLIVAHAVNARGPGVAGYASARIRIGARATIGGGARVALGCTIGEAALVEPMSNVLPFTVIGPGETWGGNPAVRRGIAAPADISTHDGTGHAADAEAACRLIESALGEPPGSIRPSTRRDAVARWDSLGQVSIAAAIAEATGRPLPPDWLFRIDSVGDVERMLAGTAPPPQSRDSQAMEPDASPELLPTGDPDHVTLSLLARGIEPASDAPPLEVRIASTFVAEPIEPALRAWCAAFGIPVRVSFLPFDRVAESLLDPKGAFRTGGPGVDVILARLDDLLDTRGRIDDARAESLLSAIESFAREHPGRLVVGSLPPVSPGAAADRAAIESLRSRWRERLASASVEIAAISETIERLGASASDAALQAAASAPWSARGFRAIGREIARAARARRVPPAKVLALDADGVLWGGVLAEDGLAGIALGSSSAGLPHQLLQRRALALKERGVLLALVSRNEEADVREAFEAHPGMALRWSDLAAWRVSWDEKSDALRSIADELGLGLDRFVFLDDDPARRAEVSARLPEVLVVPLPSEPALMPVVLDSLWVFDAGGASAPTSEDRERTRRMAEERARRESASGLSLSDHLASLGLVADVRPARDEDLARVAQLEQRTNQFNLAQRRRSEAEIRRLHRDGADVLVLSAHDHHGDYGLVGACLLVGAGDVAQIDTLLMSCRALGRGLEQAFLHAIASHARHRGAYVLTAEHVPGPRDEPLRRFLDETGFERDPAGRLSLAVASAPEWPAHVTRA